MRALCVSTKMCGRGRLDEAEQEHNRIRQRTRCRLSHGRSLIYYLTLPDQMPRWNLARQAPAPGIRLPSVRSLDGATGYYQSGQGLSPKGPLGGSQETAAGCGHRISGEKRMKREMERRCRFNKYSVPNDDLRTDWLIL